MNTPENKTGVKAEANPDEANDTQSEGVVVPEEFQKQVHALVNKAPKEHLDHIRARVSAREDELRKEEMSKKPDKFSTDGMPTTLR